jgi:phage-related protein
VKSIKQVQFLGDSRSELQSFPREVRRELGDELLSVQQGLMPTDFKAMPSVGKGAYEIRVHLDGAWRIMYVAKFPEAIYVLHA